MASSMMQQSHQYYPPQQYQPQQPLKWWQQSQRPLQPPNEFFRKHPILFQVFQMTLAAIGITFAFALFR
jgi:hypothetical protein